MRKKSVRSAVFSPLTLVPELGSGLPALHGLCALLVLICPVRPYGAATSEGFGPPGRPRESTSWFILRHGPFRHTENLVRVPALGLSHGVGGLLPLVWH